MDRCIPCFPWVLATLALIGCGGEVPLGSRTDTVGATGEATSLADTGRSPEVEGQAGPSLGEHTGTGRIS